MTSNYPPAASRPPPDRLPAPALYALSQGFTCRGDQECHWCAAACDRQFTHDEPAPEMGVRRAAFARRPGNAWVCKGCWLWRRRRITVAWLKAGYRDGRAPAEHSWLITEAEARAVGRYDLAELFFHLRHPPLVWALALLDPLVSELPNQPKNMLQFATVNDVPEVRAGTPLFFTLNNIPHTYTVFELEDGARSGEGKDPGVRALLALLGEAASLPPDPVPGGKGSRGGRPKEGADAEPHRRMRRLIRDGRGELTEE